MVVSPMTIGSLFKYFRQVIEVEVASIGLKNNYFKLKF